ncbi:cyclic nucleotide-binding domain-containing protein [Stenomitos frigidus]|uniref:Cyclic nucleotide-binding protein n=1 Tax=Stenomitos frigidus ULC18 TaxID=2107698 RepID=A0A2T1DXM0_9CYAN|nr:Crp/Fnr family transcriptional regulator [Stenomitos frigidus]PSB25124.1 cyclic nucleotide-binding protein [Stenomitos frigidus ULC18]
MLSPADTVAIFQKQPEPQAFEAGAVIFAEGQSGDVMYGILEGEVDLLINSKVIDTLQHGSVFGVGALVGVLNRGYTAVAKTNCKLASLDEYRFLFAVQETPMFALQVMKDYANRMAHLEQLA